MHIPTSLLRRAVLAIAALAIVVPATEALAAPSWGSSERIRGSGNIKKETRQLSAFNGVSLSVPANVELRIGNGESVTIETDDNILPLVETMVENGTLKIRTAKENVSLDTRTFKIVLQAKQIERLTLGGSGTINADPLKSPKLKFDIGGSGAINVKAIDSDAVSVTLGGSGNLKVAGGNAASVSMTISGSGEVDLGQVKSNDANIRLSGSGNVTVWPAKTLRVLLAGSGDVHYYGDPVVNKTVAGSGDITRAGSAPR